jgi:uncharacterized phiE125 gp8 family phage protein
MSIAALQFDSITGTVAYSATPQSCVIVTPPLSPLVTIDEAKVWLRNDRVSYDNRDIEIMIAAITEQLERACRIDFAERTRLAEWINPQRRIYLPYGVHGAINSVTAFDIEGNSRVLTTSEYNVVGLPGAFRSIDLLTTAHRVQVEFVSGYAFSVVPAAFLAAIRHELTLTMNYRSGQPVNRAVQGGMSIEARQMLQPYIKRL